MDIASVPFMTTDWSKVPETAHPGETGTAYWRTLEVGNIRVRMVRYSKDYLADHWCNRGHVLLCLEGELITELKDGSSHRTSSPARCGWAASWPSRCSSPRPSWRPGRRAAPS